MGGRWDGATNATAGTSGLAEVVRKDAGEVKSEKALLKSDERINLFKLIDDVDVEVREGCVGTGSIGGTGKGSGGVAVNVASSAARCKGGNADASSDGGGGGMNGEDTAYWGLTAITRRSCCSVRRGESERLSLRGGGGGGRGRGRGRGGAIGAEAANLVRAAMT